MEYGLIFHGTRTGKYYCKNMKYRINNVSCQQTSHKSFNIQSLTPTSSTPFIFKDFHGCTINFYSEPAASVTASNNQYDMTEFEMEQFMSDYHMYQ